MPNLARIIVNICLYFFYVVAIAFFLGFVAPIIILSLGREIPIYGPEVYNLSFFIIAGLVFVLTFLLRRSCYLPLVSQENIGVTTKSYVTKKKQKPKQESFMQSDDTDTSVDETIKIYVDKEIK